MDQNTLRGDELLYSESLSSNKTEALFVALTLLCFLLFAWRFHARRWGVLAIVFLIFSVFFLFYALNYRTLIIRLTRKTLQLKFGIFSWTVPLENIEDCRLDEIPVFKRMGGAGIHFMNIRHRYRASFNFLEYPRVVIALRRKQGPVRDISFSTRRPADLLRLMKTAISVES